MIRLTIQTPVRFSAHAVDRYCERVAIAIDPASAQRHITNLVAVAEISARPPEWLAEKTKQESELYLTLGWDVAFPLARDTAGHSLIAKTCLTRGSISEATRERRNAVNKRAQAARPNSARGHRR
jgi:hypothetical protein